MNIHADKDYWTGLQWPAAPNQDDYCVFSSYCTGRVLLLGSTRLPVYKETSIAPCGKCDTCVKLREQAIR